ncbi:MAG: hypothetical protein AAGC58_04570 [Asticcacaulis sp.]
MRKPVRPERLYLDFDGFFASCEQLKHPHLRGKPVGIIPMPQGSTSIIACSREAKARGVSNVMPVREALNRCPDMILWPQDPNLYRRAHNEMISEIKRVAPVDAIKSIDEITCKLDAVQQKNPEVVGLEIKRRIAAVVGKWITCSIGYAANRLLAKMACKASKPSGNLVWWPDETDNLLRNSTFDEVPGIGKSMKKRLWAAGIWDMDMLMNRPPRELRGLWRSVNGERMWYALHGYDIQAQPTRRGMYGHSRILPPSHRNLDPARDISRMLLVKATRRMRREGWRAGALYLGLYCITAHDAGKWSTWCRLPFLADYTGILNALDSLWRQARRELHAGQLVLRVDVTLGELRPIGMRQLDLLDNDDGLRKKEEAISDAMDSLHKRYGDTVLTNGLWCPPPGQYAGAKIAFTRVPRAEDFV